MKTKLYTKRTKNIRYSKLDKGIIPININTIVWTFTRYNSDEMEDTYYICIDDYNTEFAII